MKLFLSVLIILASKSPSKIFAGDRHVCVNGYGTVMFDTLEVSESKFKFNRTFYDPFLGIVTNRTYYGTATVLSDTLILSEIIEFSRMCYVDTTIFNESFERKSDAQAMFNFGIEKTKFDKFDIKYLLHGDTLKPYSRRTGLFLSELHLLSKKECLQPGTGGLKINLSCSF